ncbi:MAG: hypothetical protein J6D57_14415 [Mogibacterium sp.]|nr:hypothetical protein [Mogibacterium sp.]
MKNKKSLVALLLSFLMVLSQMSVAAFALDTAAPEGTDQTVTEQAVEEAQPVFIAQCNYRKLQSLMENVASPKWRKLQRIF